MRKWFSRGGMAALAAMSALVFTSTAAHAAYGDTMTVSRTGAWGSADFVWTNLYRIDDMNLTLKDTGCDGHYTYVYFRVYSAGGDWNTATRKNTLGCNSSWTVKTYINNGAGIAMSGVRMYVCVDGVGCSNLFHQNPYWKP